MGSHHERLLLPLTVDYNTSAVIEIILHSYHGYKALL